MLTGCATVPTQESGLPTYYINGRTYLPLSSICDLKNINWDYDTFTKTVTLKKDIHELNLSVGNAMVLVDGIPKTLQSPVEIYQGIIVVPSRFKRDILDSLFKPVYPKSIPTGPYIKKIRRIVLDPGHGGKDPGAIGITGLREKKICLEITRRLKTALDSSGFEVFLTRDSDEFISLKERVDFANRKDADLFISIHANFNRAKWISGFEVYYVYEQVDEAQDILASAQNSGLGMADSYAEIQKVNLKAAPWDSIYSQNRSESIELARHICKYVSNNLDIGSSGSKSGPYFVLKWTHMPSVLVEVGYLSNAYEEKMLRKAFYLQEITEAIAGGIRNYCQDYRLTLGSH